MLPKHEVVTWVAVALLLQFWPLHPTLHAHVLLAVQFPLAEHTKGSDWLRPKQVVILVAVVALQARPVHPVLHEHVLFAVQFPWPEHTKGSDWFRPKHQAVLLVSVPFKLEDEVVAVALLVLLLVLQF